MDALKDPYPGESATPEDVLKLAEAYAEAASYLKEKHQRGQPLTQAPGRLCAIHAVELYLNAFLAKAGFSAADIRGMHHNLSRHAEVANGHKLALRKKTYEHLCTLADNREYLSMRYEPNNDGTKVSELNRIYATLTDVREKVRKLIVGIEPPE